MLNETTKGCVSFFYLCIGHLVYVSFAYQCLQCAYVVCPGCMYNVCTGVMSVDQMYNMSVCFQYIKEFGTDHLYNADTFNEMTPKTR